MKRRNFAIVWCALGCIAAFAPLQMVAYGKGNRTAAASSVYQRRQISGTVVGIGGRFAGRTRPFTLNISRFTSPAEVQRLNSALQSGGQDELMRVLSGMDSGQISIGYNVGVPANAIISSPQPDGGTRIIVLFQRDIRLFELRYGTRSENYRFGYAEMFLDRNGRGEGTFIAAAQVRLKDGNTWEVEDFGTFPARLMGLRMSGGGRAR